MAKFVVMKENTNTAFEFNHIIDAVNYADDRDMQELLSGEESDGSYWLVYEHIPRGGWYVRSLLWLARKLAR